MTFVQRHDLWTPAQREAAREVARRVEADGIELVRFAFPDQHGILRGKALVAAEALRVLESGVSVTTTLLAKDTSHKTVFPVFTRGGGLGLEAMQGGGDVLMVPDPTTFRVLPWADKTASILCDLHWGDGLPCPFATRAILRDTLGTLAGRGYDYVAGLEVECHLFRLVDAKMEPHHAGQPGEPPAVQLLSHGYQYLTEQRYDVLEPLVTILRRDLLALGLPLRSIEVEYGPSQVEFVFAPGTGLDPADLMVTFRSATKQICRRHGYHATFMCRPRIPNVMSSGWHLHQSLRERASGRNAFMSAGSDPASSNVPHAEVLGEAEPRSTHPRRASFEAELRSAPQDEEGSDGGHELLSPLARSFMAGLLAHAREAAVFTTPTVNGYRRFRSYSLAPDRAIWARDSRGVMVRVLGAPGDPATRLENRIGEPAANPYLYMASQILSGLDGVDRNLDPGPSADTPYEADAPRLPTSLAEAVTALDRDPFFRDRLGDRFVDYLVHIKRAELARFDAEVTDWEHREYFEMF